MRTSTALLLIVFAMHFITLINITLLNGTWNGFVLAINTILFVLAVFLYSSNKYKNKGDRKR